MVNISVTIRKFRTDRQEHRINKMTDLYNIIQHTNWEPANPFWGMMSVPVFSWWTYLYEFSISTMNVPGSIMNVPGSMMNVPNQSSEQIEERAQKYLPTNYLMLSHFILK